MPMRRLVCLVPFFLISCQSTEHLQPPSEHELAAAPSDDDGKKEEANEGILAHFSDIAKVTFEHGSSNDGGYGFKIKISPDAIAKASDGQTIGLALYRLDELTPEAVYESGGLRRVRAKKVATLDMTYAPGQAYDFAVLDMTGALEAPIVLKITPLPESPESDASVFLPKAETMIHGVYLLPGKGQQPKAFDLQTLRLDLPSMFQAE